MWTGLTSRDHGPEEYGRDGAAEKDSMQQGPVASDVSVARTPERLEFRSQVGGRVLVSTWGALEGRWMWGLTIHGLCDAPTFAMRGNTGQAGTGQLACGPAVGLLTSGWAGRFVPGPEGPSPRS